MIGVRAERPVKSYEHLSIQDRAAVYYIDSSITLLSIFILVNFGLLPLFLKF